MLAVFRKTLDGLRPVDETGQGILRKFKLGAEVAVDLKQPRNLKHHRKMFALLEKVVENQERFTNARQLLAAIQIATGYTERVRVRGVVHEVPTSIAFHNMSQEEFEQLYDRSVDFILSDVLPGLGRAELEAEIQEMLR